MCEVNTGECLSQAENGRQQLHVAYGICGGEYSPFSLSLWAEPVCLHGHLHFSWWEPVRIKLLVAGHVGYEGLRKTTPYT